MARKGLLQPAGAPDAPTTPKTEAELRVELAAAYRIVAWLGLDDGIQNHLTVKIPGASDEYLINSYGMGFEEVTASSLVKVDHAGNVLDPGSVAPAVNRAGFNIHSAIHAARKDCVCVMHSHEAHCTAVSNMKCGFQYGLSQYALICGEVAHHPYDNTIGPSGPAECAKLAAALGSTAHIMLLENHGVVTSGATVAEALLRLVYVTKASTIQVHSNVASEESLQGVHLMKESVTRKRGAGNFFGSVGDAEFRHYRRIIDRVNPGYDDLATTTWRQQVDDENPISRL